MEKEYLKNCIDKDMSISQIATENNKSVSTISYWLKKFGLKTKNKSFKDGGSKIDYTNGKFCPKCNEIKSIDNFYDRRGKIGGAGYCKSCMNNQRKDLFREFKQICVDYKGGKCENCGYDKYIGALQFHHIDPTKKDFALSRTKTVIFDDKTKKELDKCILLCANCHSEVHGDIT